MADFNINDPSTFAISTGTFKGSYYYTIAVIPSDPSTYTGPPFFTITTSSLYTEEQLLERAQQIADSTYRYKNQNQTFEFSVVGATVKAGVV